MASYGSMKLPPNLDKPPLFSYAYRIGASESNKPVNFYSLPEFSRISDSVSPANGFKVPKVEENELFFSSDLDTLSFKRPKFTDEGHQPQGSDSPVVPFFTDQRSSSSLDPANDHGKDEDVSSSTKAESIDMDNQFNPLNEPSPLGLNLRKSPSLLDLIQRKLAQNEEDGSERCDQGGNLSRLGSLPSSVDKDKLKAANFPASKLRIGTWECTSRYDGELVAKCYYAKRKLVWEVLGSTLKNKTEVFDSTLKSKMEVQWSDISAMKASFPDHQPAVFDIELFRPPLFFREIKPQPRKHTLWQSTSDFTEGQATICRHHSVHFPAGILNRHYEKLLQCDVRLKALSEQTRSIQDSYFFDNRSMQIDRQHMLHYQSVLSDHAALQPLAVGGTNDEGALVPAFHAIECYQSHVSVQGLQNVPLQYLSPHQENLKNTRLEALMNEPLQQRLAPVLTDTVSGAGFHRQQGGFHLQLTTAMLAMSPSSVIDTDTRVLHECSSSSETEEAPLKDICRSDAHDEAIKLHTAQENCRQFSILKNGRIGQVSDWASRWSQDGMLAWNVDSTLSSTVNHSSEKQALNELSLHLLGEPIPITDACQYSMGRASGRRMLMSRAGSGNVPLATRFNKDLFHKREQSPGGAMHRDSQWNAAVLVEHCTQEGGSAAALPSHGSYLDFVCLPQVASQQQFLE